MICCSCSAEVASTTVFCPHCGERVESEFELPATGLFAKGRGTTLLNADNSTGMLSHEYPREQFDSTLGKIEEKPE